MTTIKLGGANGHLTCEKCGNLRWPGSKLCGDCYGLENPGHGTRNRSGLVVQQRLSTELWQAVNFAGSMIRKGQPFHKAVVVAARYYHVDADEVQKALAQRSGRSRKKPSPKQK